MFSKQLQIEGEPASPSLVLNAISSHLLDLGHPLKSVNSMLRCGSYNGHLMEKKCGCGSELIPTTHRCNLRTCPSCAKTRKRRIFARFLPFFKKYKTSKGEFFQFLTINPPNYDNLEEGFEHIRKSFSKFLRRKYIKERIKAGFYVLETKQNENGSWNLHLHAVIYGRWLDYRIRGRCLECGQNLLRYDKFKERFHCANRKCGSLNVMRKKGTRLVREWEDSSSTTAHVYGERLKSIHGAVSYLTKYVAVDKTTFLGDRDTAIYIKATAHKKLITGFGQFFKDKLGKIKINWECRQCGEQVEFYFDLEISYYFGAIIFKPPNPQKTLSAGWKLPKELTCFHPSETFK